MKFKIGDRVRCHKKDHIDSELVLSLEGVICAIDSRLKQPYKVEFYSPKFGSFTWLILEESIELVVQKTAEELEKELIERICKKIKYLDSKYERHMERKKEQKWLDSYITNLVQNAEAETTSQDMRTGLGGVSDAGSRRCLDEVWEGFQRIAAIRLAHLDQHIF